MNVGFIGLGIMGTPMALHLVEAGHQLFVHTRSRVPDAIASTSARSCASAAEVAKQSDAIVTMVPDTPDVERVLFGPGGIAESLPGSGARKVVVDMSSISPIATKAFAEKIRGLGADYVDAPVSGGEVGAKAASLTIMCGAEPAVFERVRPLLEKMGKNITLVGGNGDGQTTKVANQIIVALNIAAVGEALVFASRAGADPASLRISHPAAPHANPRRKSLRTPTSSSPWCRTRRTSRPFCSGRTELRKASSPARPSST